MFNTVNEIKFLKPYNKFFAISGLMPIFNFEQGNIKNEKWFKFYCAIYAFIQTIYWFVAVFHIIQHIYSYLTLPQAFLMALSEIVDILIRFYTILSTGFWNMNNWRKFLKNSIYIEKCLKIHETGNTKKFFLTFLFVNTLLISSIIGCFIESSRGISSKTTFIHYAVMFSYQFVLNCLFILLNGVLLDMHFKFEKLKKTLETTCIIIN